MSTPVSIRPRGNPLSLGRLAQDIAREAQVPHSEGIVADAVKPVGDSFATEQSARRAVVGPAVRPVVGRVGSLGTVLLSGPTADGGPADLALHVARWGALAVDTATILDVLDSSEIDGRGGGGFPLRRKVDAARAAGHPLVIVNASESEPASRKDATLCTLRPHLVLDGAALVAKALGTSDVVVHMHRGSGMAGPLRAAIDQRKAAGFASADSWNPDRSHTVVDPAWRLSEGPDRYVSGESSAVASSVEGAEARPYFTTSPLAVSGPSGRPTVVSNVETLAHLAVAVRIGGDAWRALGSDHAPGTRLVTLTGAVAEPGLVVEASGLITMGDLLHAGGLTHPPAAVLVGGFGGSWIDGARAWTTPFSRPGLSGVDAGPGCGMVGVLPSGACGLAETARIVAYLAGESAGQCGSCVSGLPRLASALADLASGRMRRRGLRKTASLAEEIFGSGACGHPDAVVRLVRSALDVFAGDVAAHLDGGPCSGVELAPVFAVPDPRRIDGSGGAWL
jgi:NADH:ubiquinone oxidoreductase subunit F (NADH-binding)